MIYKINNNEQKVKIFDVDFVNNNKDNCKIIYNHEEFELKDYFDVDKNNEKLEIKLKGIKNITNASKMFYGCSNLESVPDIINWDLSNITEKQDMFNGTNENFIIPKNLSSK